MLAVAEAGLVGDGLHRVAPLLQHQTGGLDPQALHRLGRRLAGLLAEGALNWRELSQAASASSSRVRGFLRLDLA